MDRLEQIEQDGIDTNEAIMVKWRRGELTDETANLALAANEKSTRQSFRIACGLSPDIQYDIPIEYR